MANPKNLTAALAYACRGWSVFAVRPKSKVPLTLHGFHDATTDPSIIRQWWDKNPACGVGIATGHKSGIIVVDVDPRSQGDETFEALELQHGEFPPTVEARTGGGGRHLIYTCPPGIWAGGKGLWQGIDIKADGGYIVAPFSIHPSGTEYLWVNNCGPVIPGEEGGIEPAECPQWILTALQDRVSRRIKARTENPKDSDSPFSEGGRNNALASLAGTMRRRSMSQPSILAAMLAENEVRCEPPLPAEEVATIVESICRYAADEDASPKQISKEAKAGNLLKWADPVMMGMGKEPEIQWILEGWLAKNDCSLFFGPPGAGKSWLMMDLAITCATGLPTFGYFDRGGESLKVLMVDEENTYEEVWRRVHKLLKAWELNPKTLAGQLYLTHPCQGFSFAHASYGYAIEKAVEKIRPDIIIFDSVTALSGIKREADAVEIRAFFHDKLYPLRAICNSAIVVVHHSNKGIYQIEQQVQDAGLARGSIDFLAAPDSVWMLKPVQDGSDIMTVRSAKVRRGKIPEPFRIHIVDGAKGGARPMVISQSNKPGRPENKANTELKKGILRMLSDNPDGCKGDSLRTWVQLSLSTTFTDDVWKKAIKNLDQEGEIRYIKDHEDKRKSVYFRCVI